eukprot:COSAG06_NODE_5949_length_3192_cov_1.335920_4_plen_294_part_01
MSKTLKTIRIGCRPSKLAVAQTKQVEASINQQFPDIKTSIHTYKSEGDINQTDPLYELGGKNIFIKTLETQLLNNTVDLLVHSLKDVTTKLTSGLELAGIISGPSIRDCLILHPKYKQNKNTPLSIKQLPTKAKIGTSSLRRIAQLKLINPHFKLIPMRGNIDTRIQKLQDQDLDAIMLAEAGLIRLGMQKKIDISLNENNFIPAPNQGLLGLEIRQNSPEHAPLSQLCKTLSDTQQINYAKAQLKLISELSFNCNHPFGSYVDNHQTQTHFSYFLASPDLSNHIQTSLPINNK